MRLAVCIHGKVLMEQDTLQPDHIMSCLQLFLVVLLMILHPQILQLALLMVAQGPDMAMALMELAHMARRDQILAIYLLQPLGLWTTGGSIF